MTNKTKAAIEVAATKAWEADARHNPYPNNPYAYRNGFKAGAKEVIEHPGRYGLITQDKALQSYSDQQNAELMSEIERWKEVSELGKKSIRGLIKANERLEYLESDNAGLREIVEELESQLTKYRIALERLERFTSDNPDYEFINHIAKEALKQEVNND